MKVNVRSRTRTSDCSDHLRRCQLDRSSQEAVVRRITLYYAYMREVEVSESAASDRAPAGASLGERP